MLSTELKTDHRGETYLSVTLREDCSPEDLDKLWFLTGFASLTPELKEKFILELVALCEHYYRAGVVEGATKTYIRRDLLPKWASMEINSTLLEPPPGALRGFDHLIDGKKLLEDNLDPDGFLVQIVNALQT
jgi:hypothetical protein